MPGTSQNSYDLSLRKCLTAGRIFGPSTELCRPLPVTTSTFQVHLECVAHLGVPATGATLPWLLGGQAEGRQQVEGQIQEWQGGWCEHPGGLKGKAHPGEVQGKAYPDSTVQAAFISNQHVLKSRMTDLWEHPLQAAELWLHGRILAGFARLEEGQEVGFMVVGAGAGVDSTS
ncbi:MAG: hypothetical protein FRX49_05123 [Trebouxia sp. A1-2]|nr:MAG: hypothetical protein FRX49_05123 [Trebouxia sp. A1-2]